MVDIFDFKARSPRFAVIGNPIKHSKSPEIHEAFAQQFGLALSYEAISLDATVFEQGVRNLQASGLTGLNITVPFKQTAWQLADELTDRARASKAVNTLSFSDSDLIAGDNTDGIGLMRDLENNLGFIIKGSKILVSGAGGAARGILPALIEGQPKKIVITNRTPSKARELLTDLNSPENVSTCPPEKIEDNFDIVINATSASLSGQVAFLREEIFGPSTLAYDLAYGDKTTAFLRWALHSGAKQTVDGLGMLVEQAAEAFYIWNRHRPDTSPVISALRTGVK